MTKVTTTFSFEVELALSGTFSPGLPERGPTYASGGQPAEDDTIEDIEVEGVSASVQTSDDSGKTEWESIDLMEGVDINSPDIQRFFDNLLSVHNDAVVEALLAEVEE